MSDWQAAINAAHSALDEAIEGLHTNNWDILDLLSDIELPSTQPPTSQQARLAELLARITAFRAAVEAQLRDVSAAIDSTGRIEAANRAYLSS